ncbi:S8 family serine peptidase [uncultured Azohydromonas sp.]|uniref:S8 family serine peptidase n=1 Tax=uncultured Azohydromonas sp. TaxID=487342 RepID=UPI002612A7CF|nr:S8 family serine peptidase [uncultured Azohydromonas sp.]
MKHGAVATALAASALLAAGAAQAKPQPLFQNPGAAPVNGLIVRLRDAPAHAEVEREQALSRDRRSARGEKHRERLQRVLREAAMDRAAIDVPSAPAISPTGHASQVLRFDKPLTLEQAQRLARRLAARGDVLWVEPNVRERRLQVANRPNDPDFGQQWWLQPLNTQSNAQVNALPIEQRLRGVPRFQEAWSIATGVNIDATRVAVLDSGITNHEDLEGRWIGGYDFVSTIEYAGDGNGRDPDPHDPGDFVTTTSGAFSGCEVENSSWHGTKIAGLISAITNNNRGVAGANQGNLIVPVRVAGKCGADVSDITDGIRWAAGLPVSGVPANPFPARIINISFGSTAACGSEYQDAIEAVRAVGAVVVAAAGNEHTAPTRPANCSNTNVIGVGALNRDGFKAVYSNFGTLTVSTVGGDPDDTNREGAWNTVLGDGGLWTTTDTGLQSPVGSGYTNEGVIGTSFSAPLVSATISLMLSRNSALTADQIVAGLKASARPHVVSSLLVNGAPAMAACSNENPGRCVCTTSTCGAGILDAVEALNYAANPTGYRAPTRVAADINTAELVSAHAAATQDLPANPPVTPPPPNTPAGPCGSDGICGGATQPAWLLGLLAASGVLLWGGRRAKEANRRR